MIKTWTAKHTSRGVTYSAEIADIGAPRRPFAWSVYRDPPPANAGPTGRIAFGFERSRRLARINAIEAMPGAPDWLRFTDGDDE